MLQPVFFSARSCRLAWALTLLVTAGCTRESKPVPEAAPPQEFRLQGHKAPIADLAFSPDGKWLATAGQDKTLRLWDLASRTQAAEVPFTEEVFRVQFSPDGRQLVAGDGRGRRVFWDVAGRKIARDLKGSGGSVTAISFAPDGQLLAYAAPNFVYLWPVQEPEPKVLLIDSIDALYIVQELAFSPDGRWLAAARSDKIVAVYDVHAILAAEPTLKRAYGGVLLEANPVLKPVAVLKGHGDEVRGVGFTPDGRQLVSASKDRTLRFWDVASWKQTKEVPVNSEVYSFAASPVTSQAIVSDGKQTQVFDLAAQRQVRVLKGGAFRVALSRDGRWLARSMGDYAFVQELPR